MIDKLLQDNEVGMDAEEEDTIYHPNSKPDYLRLCYYLDIHKIFLALRHCNRKQELDGILYFLVGMAVCER